MKKILTLLSVLISFASVAQSQFSGIVLYVADSATYRASATIVNAHANGKADLYWNAQATNPHFDWWDGAAYQHGFSSGGGGGATAAGATGNVQYKSAGGGLQAEAAFTYDSATNVLTVGNITLPSGAVLNFNSSDVTITHSSNLLTIAGGELVVPAEAYASGWDGDNSAPTKNDVYDKIETLAAGVIDQASASTAGGTITLDMNSQLQRSFVGSATFATPKTIAISNVLSGSTQPVFFNFFFEITNVAAVLTLPSDAKMSSIDWDGTDWTPPNTGIYEMAGSYNNTGDYWSVKIYGPEN